MGKIPEYQRSRLASSYVGEAQKDTSGEMLMETATKVLDPIRRQLLGELKEAQGQLADQAANKSVMQYSLAFQEEAMKMQEAYADNPQAYPDAVFNMGQTLSAEYEKAIPDDRVKQRFLSAANVMQRQAVNSSIDWRFKKEQENAQINIFDSLELAVVTAGNSPQYEVLDGAVQAIDSTLNLSDSKYDGIPHTKKVEMRMEYSKRALDSHLAKRLDVDPYGLAIDLTEGKYDNYSVQLENEQSIRLPLDAETKSKYIEKAKSAEAKAEYRKLLDDTIRFEGASRALAQKYFDGAASIGDIQKELNRATAAKEPAEYINNVNTLLTVALAKRTTTAYDDPMVVLPIDNALADLGEDLVYRKAKIKKKGRETPETKKRAAAMLTDLMKLQNQSMAAYADGKMSRAKLQTILGTISGSIRTGVLAQEEVGKGLLAYRDEYGARYKSIYRQINAMRLPKEMSDSAKVQATTYFIENITDAKKITVGELSKAQYDTAEQKAIDLVRLHRDPNYAHLKIGDEVEGFKVKGFRPDGQPLLDVPAGLAERIKNSGN